MYECGMATNFIPVETILKVDEDEELISHDSINISHTQPEESSSVPGFISIGTQCPPLGADWNTEHRTLKDDDITPVLERNITKENTLKDGNRAIEVNSLEGGETIMKPWTLTSDHNTCNDQKLLLTAGFSQQLACNFQTFPVDEKFFLQFDYKTRNKLKTKQRRLDPFYRNQERIRQRTVMRLKRQDPRFRAVEREKGRYRMRIKRLDPIFRSQERERQRERMKLKRRDPNFREREREQQKTRLHVKRLNPRFKEKEKAQDRIRMRIKRHNNGSFSTLSNAEKHKIHVKNAVDCITTNSQMCYKNSSGSSYDAEHDMQNTNEGSDGSPISSEHLNDVKPLSLKDSDVSDEPFHHRRAHVLNFNFYNSGKEHWPTQAELCTKGIAHFNIAKEDLRFHTAFNATVNQDNAVLLAKEHAELSNMSTLKNDMNCPTELNTKHESLSVDMPATQERHSSNLMIDGNSKINSTKFDTTTNTFSPPQPHISEN